MKTSKILPQDTALEEVILGAILLDAGAISRVVDVLIPDSFYSQAHAEVYRCMIRLYEAGEPIDLLTVTHQLRRDGTLKDVGGPAFVSQLTNRVASTANLETHAHIIKSKHILRMMITASADCERMAYDESEPEAIARLWDTSVNSLIGADKGVMSKLSDIIPELSQSIEDSIQGIKNGVSTGFPAIDKIIYGWNKTDLTYIAARPGMGKTAFALSSAIKMGQAGIPIAFFSLEMSKKQILSRAVSQITGIEYGYINHGPMDESRLKTYHECMGRVEALPIYIDDTPALSVFELRAKCKRLKERHGIQAIFVDYVQLMTVGMGVKMMNREQEISTISRNLKRIAKELDLPVIALAQVSRGVEDGKSKRPTLRDLRESGSLEQDADIVAMLYRDEYYGIDTDASGNSTKGSGEFIVAKNRNGKIDTALLRFVEHLAQYDNLSQTTLFDAEPDKFIESSAAPF